MGYYTKRTDRMDFHIEEDRKTITIRQKWKYSWLTSSGATPWTYTDKQAFHTKVDNLIWNTWGKAFYLKVVGGSDFAKRNAGERWDVDFDIEWVLGSQHWDVNVTKYPRAYSGNPTSSVGWAAKVITLDTKDTAYRARTNGGRIYNQYPVVHEFGHAAGNSIHARAGMHGDEYNSTSAYFGDKQSVMNIGNTFRERHLDYILTQLNTIITDTNFKKY